jgi:hypothetical protein
MSRPHTHTHILFEDKVLRSIFSLQRQEVAGGWRKSHEELHNLDASPNVIREIKSRRMRWAGHVTCVREMRNECKVLIGKPEGKRPLGKPSHSWEDNIRIVTRKIGK